MPKALDLPEDLIALARTRRAAELAMETAARGDSDITAEREAFIQAATAVNQHPLLDQARTEGCYAQTWQALIDAVKSE